MRKILFTSCLLFGIAVVNAVAQVTPDTAARPGKPETFFLRFASPDNRPTPDQVIPVLRERLKLTENETVRLTGTTTDQANGLHRRFQLYYNNVKVEHSIIQVHMRKGLLTSINGERQTLPRDLNTLPVLTEDRALELARASVGADAYMWEAPEREAWLKNIKNDTRATYFPDGELVIVGGRLAWKFDIYASEPETRDYVYVDAQDGKILLKNARINHTNETGTAETRYSGTRTLTTEQTAPGQYRLRDYSRGEGIMTFDLNHSTNDANATDLVDSSNYWTQAEYKAGHRDNLLDAQWGAEVAYDYWWNVHQRKSYDDDQDSSGLGAPIICYVRYGVSQGSAFWNGTSLHFGDGGNKYFGKTSLDCIAHELGHGIDDKTSDLINDAESGALDEGMSDIWAACVEHYANKTLGLSKEKWLFEEELVNPLYFNGALRSLVNPKQVGDPDTYKGLYWQYASNFDKGGIHHNCAVLGHWFYILSEGKQGTNDFGFAYSVNGITIEKAEKILYLAQRNYFTPNFTYPDAREATILAATDLYPQANAPEVQAVKDAWDAVGVYDLGSLSYCIPTVSIAAGAFIASLQIGMLKKWGGYSGPSGYTDCSKAENGILYAVKGSTLPVALYANSQGSTHHWKVWMDFNNNGSFDDSGELIYQAVNAGQVANGIIAVPLSTQHAIIKMRVSLNWPSPQGNSCDPLYSGEVEDYAVVFIEPLTTADGYCIPFGSQNIDDWIEAVQVGSIEKNEDNKKSTYYGYQDFYEKHTLDALPGETVQFKLTGGASTPGDDYYWTGWIDYDNDKEFESGEIVFQTGPHAITDQVIQSVTIPSWLAVGPVRRIRIGISRNVPLTDPCMVSYGEFEDYSLHIIDTCPIPGAKHTSAVIGAQTNFMWNAAFTALQYEIAYSPTLTNEWSYVTVPTTSVQVPMDNTKAYIWKIRSHCLVDSSAWSEIMVVDTLDYCTGSSVDDQPRINTLNIGDLDHPGSSLSYHHGFFDFTKSGTDYVLDLPVGESVPVLFNFSAYSPMTGYWSVWIDFDNNGFFSQAELVVTGSSTTNNPFTTIYNVPANLSASTTRMRVVLNSDPGSNSCAKDFYGQTKDYRVEIIPVCHQPVNLEVRNINTTSAVISWADAYGAGEYTVQYRETNAVKWESLHVTGVTSALLPSLSPSTSYEIRVQRICLEVVSPYTYGAFTTLCPGPPDDVKAKAVTAGTAEITWHLVPGQDVYKIRHRVSGDSSWIIQSVKGSQESLINLNPGTLYEFQVATACALNDSEWSSMVTFTTDYCASQGQVSKSDWIDLVQAGTLNNPSGNNNGYEFFAALQPPALKQGDSYTLSYSAGQATKVRTRYFKAWIDFNNDHGFSDAGEQVMSNVSASTLTLSTTISIPANAVPGVTRMRVSLKYNAAITGPCEVIPNGEVEDYHVNITNAGGMGARLAAVEAEEMENNVTDENETHFYPNPVTYELKVKIGEEYIQGKITIIDVVGRTWFVKENNEQRELSIGTTAWSAGIYMLILRKGKTVSYYKIIKE